MDSFWLKLLFIRVALGHEMDGGGKSSSSGKSQGILF